MFFLWNRAREQGMIAPYLQGGSILATVL